MNLPIRVNPEVQITEDDTESGHYAEAIGSVRYELLTLCQVLHAVIWELTWNGPAEGREMRRREIMERAREADKHPERLIEFDPEDLKKRILDK